MRGIGQKPALVRGYDEPEPWHNKSQLLAFTRQGRLCIASYSVKVKVEKDFIKADSANLPKVDSFMIANFFASNPDFCSAEFRNVKTSVTEKIEKGFRVVYGSVVYLKKKRDWNEPREPKAHCTTRGTEANVGAAIVTTKINFVERAKPSAKIQSDK
ncbi:hypothetical protein EVAR_95023_1 [Eumeta japonica]|uniref:Uncharacterized protein n=1 Tax=Eumeta variegata TaxID=151549 RepID=A0A4C1VVU6_EUMVA|nr:hypothetical protein EVAR_95023_1 [Eumeta japonica]